MIWELELLQHNTSLLVLFVLQAFEEENLTNIFLKVLALAKCKMLAFTGKTVLSKAHITIDDHTIQSGNSLEYLGSTCTLDKSKIKWSAPGVTIPKRRTLN